MTEISSNDYFDLGSLQSWNFMDWSKGEINKTALDNYLDSYAKQMHQNGLQETTFSFGQVCDIQKMIAGDFKDCSKTSSLEMLDVNTGDKEIDGKSVVAYMTQRLRDDGLNVNLSFGGAAATADDWNFNFSQTDPATLAKNLSSWAHECGFSGIDFDMETGAEGLIQQNGASNLATFFYSLHQEAQGSGMPVTLTLMGDSGQWGPQGSVLGGIFSQGHNISQMFDGVNLMLYNGQYYLNAGQKPLEGWDLTKWMDQLQKNTGMSPSDCASFMHIGFDGGGLTIRNKPVLVAPCLMIRARFLQMYKQVGSMLRISFSKYKMN